MASFVFSEGDSGGCGLGFGEQDFSTVQATPYTEAPRWKHSSQTVFPKQSEVSIKSSPAHDLFSLRSSLQSLNLLGGIRELHFCWYPGASFQGISYDLLMLQKNVYRWLQADMINVK